MYVRTRRLQHSVAEFIFLTAVDSVYVYVNVRQPQDTCVRVHRSSYICTYVKIRQPLHQHTLVYAYGSRHKQYMYIPKTLADIQMASLFVSFSAAVITVPSTPSAVGSLSRQLIPRSPPPQYLPLYNHSPLVALPWPCAEPSAPRSLHWRARCCGSV